MLYLRRKLGLLRKDQSGQSLVFVAMMLFIMFLFVCVTVDVGDFVAQKIDVQNDADAMAISTAVWQARGLNVIQMLNVMKNVAHLSYMFEGAEAIQQCLSGGLFNIYCWDAVIGVEGLVNEKPDMEEELLTLSIIQTYIAGVENHYDDYDMTDHGSVKTSIKAAIFLMERQNNDGTLHAVSSAVNQAAAGGLVYDADLKIDFVGRAPFYQAICEAFDFDCDFPLFDWIASFIEVDFSWALQSRDYIEEQYTVGFGIRDVRPAPLFKGSFKSKSLVRELFGGSLPLFFDQDLQMALAQAKPFKPDPYTLAPTNFNNGMAANLLALPFFSIFGIPSGNTNCIWDVKLTPVTVVRNLAPPLTLWVTH